MLSVGDSVADDILQEDLKTDIEQSSHTITLRTPLVSS